MYANIAKITKGSLRFDPPRLFWPKLLKILKNINYFMPSKSGLVLKKTADPPPSQFRNFPYLIFFLK